MKKIAQITFLMVIISALLALIINKIFEGEKLIFYIIGSSILGTVLTHLLLHRVKHDELHNNLIKELQELRGTVSDSETLLNLPEERKAIKEISKSTFNINNKEDNYFFSDIAKSELRNYASVISDIDSGSYECGPENEVFLTKQIILDTKSSICAVSYQDTEWWTCEEGNSYLRLHLDAIKKRQIEKATRIFIATEEEEHKLKDVLDKHRQFDVEALIVRPTEIASNLKKDIVIYDKKIVRVAESVEGALGKNATFSSKENDVHKYLANFEMLETIAKSKET